MSRADPRVIEALRDAIDGRLASLTHRPVVIGLCGSQGCGKSTLASAVLGDCEERGIAAATLSIDDLYLTRAERLALARDIHPLLATRGPSGTHDVALGLAVLSALRNGEEVALPRFDKGSDDRAPRNEWRTAPDHCEVLVFEGWCVGAVPQSGEDLREPVNALEALEDPEGIWRQYVNTALGGAYQELFGWIDCLVLLAAPDFEIVFEWRLQQEKEMRERAGSEATRAMDEAAIARFIQHYERLTRHILAEMPARADILVRLDENRTALGIIAKPQH